MNRRRWTVVATALFSLAAAWVAAAPPAGPTERLVPYQGFLEENGTAVGAGGAPATKQMAFHLFSADTGGTQLFTDTFHAVVVTDGRFGVDIGPVPKAVFDNAEVHIEVNIQTTGTAFVALPRQRIQAVPYAFHGEVGKDFDAASLRVAGLSTLTGALTVGGTLAVTGLTTLSGGLSVATITSPTGNTLTTPSNLSVGGGITMNGTDFIMGNVVGRGDGGRALVHGGNDQLVVNFAKDFAGGLLLEGPVDVAGALAATGNLSAGGNVSATGTIDLGQSAPIDCQLALPSCTCPAGTTLLTGGVSCVQVIPGGTPVVTFSRPAGNNGWEANCTSIGGGATFPQIRLRCARIN